MLINANSTRLTADNLKILSLTYLNIITSQMSFSLKLFITLKIKNNYFLNFIFIYYYLH